MCVQRCACSAPAVPLQCCTSTFVCASMGHVAFQACMTMNSKVRCKAQLGEPVRSYLLGGEVGYLPGRTSKKLESQSVQSELLILL